MLSDFKCIKELNLTKSGVRANFGKEIADGLMRAKQLEVIKLRDLDGLNPT